MKSLPQPIKEEFEIQGDWVISKTANKFSGIPFDQAHGQENCKVKGAGFVLVLQKPCCFQMLDAVRTRAVKPSETVRERILF